MSDMSEVLNWAANEYRLCIIAARASIDSDSYATNNGRAEAYRQLAVKVAEAADLRSPNWESIKDGVPADGVYR